MLQFKEYTNPASLDEASEILRKNKTAALLGGGAYLRLGKKTIGLAVDLVGLGLDEIEDFENTVRIGAMVTFGDLERSPLLEKHFFSTFSAALRDVVGVQFRNTVTVGGTVFSRYGFSDLLPPLLALNASVTLQEQGEMSLDALLRHNTLKKDILTHITIPKSCTASLYKALRLSTGDYATLNLALARVDNQWRIAVGARPGRAQLAIETMKLINESPLNAELIQQACILVSNELTYGNNSRGSSEYRRKIASALLSSALKEAASDDN